MPPDTRTADGRPPLDKAKFLVRRDGLAGAKAYAAERARYHLGTANRANAGGHAYWLEVGDVLRRRGHMLERHG